MDIIEQLQCDEGFKEHVYKCTAGCDTIGYGYNLASNPLRLNHVELREARHDGVSKAKAAIWLTRIVESNDSRLSKSFTFYNKLSDARKGVLLNMSYQLGFYGLAEFKHAITYLAGHDYGLVANEMSNSKWARQTPERAKRLIVQMRTGEWQ